VACLADCATDSEQRFTISADHTKLVAIDNGLPGETIPVDHTVSIENGTKVTLLHYTTDRRELRLFSSQPHEMFRSVGRHLFDVGLAPTGITSTSDIGDGVILVQLHVDPTNSWFAVCNTRTRDVRAYFAADCACDKSGANVAFIAGQPHFGSDTASVFINGRAVAVLAAKNYWHIRWDTRLGSFVLFNEQKESIQLCMPSVGGLDMSDVPASPLYVDEKMGQDSK